MPSSRSGSSAHKSSRWTRYDHDHNREKTKSDNTIVAKKPLVAYDDNSSVSDSDTLSLIAHGSASTRKKKTIRKVSIKQPSHSKPKQKQESSESNYPTKREDRERERKETSEREGDKKQLRDSHESATSKTSRGSRSTERSKRRDHPREDRNSQAERRSSQGSPEPKLEKINPRNGSRISAKKEKARIHIRRSITPKKEIKEVKPTKIVKKSSSKRNSLKESKERKRAVSPPLVKPTKAKGRKSRSIDRKQTRRTSSSTAASSSEEGEMNLPGSTHHGPLPPHRGYVSRPPFENGRGPHRSPNSYMNPPGGRPFPNSPPRMMRGRDEGYWQHPHGGRYRSPPPPHYPPRRMSPGFPVERRDFSGLPMDHQRPVPIIRRSLTPPDFRGRPPHSPNRYNSPLPGGYPPPREFFHERRPYDGHSDRSPRYFDRRRSFSQSPEGLR